MLKRVNFFMLMITTIFSISCVVSADDQLQLTHKVIASEQNGSYHTISFVLTINNFSEKDLNRVKLIPSSSEFSRFNQDKLINIGHLPSMGQAIIEWSVETPMDVSYFQSDMPIFYIIKAKHNNGENIEIPVYSSGSITL